MNEEVPDRLPDPGCRLYLLRLDDPDRKLPIAAARNLAASHASGEVLAFLDVDCIPGGDYLQLLGEAVRVNHALVMGDVRYLPEGAADGDWDEDHLERLGEVHPRRPQPRGNKPLVELPYPLFWSLSFGIRALDFARLGGFDEAYSGYGGEDTDFAFAARRNGLPFFGCRARVYHQYHPTYSPPYNHLSDLIVNANRFYEKWGNWPMEGWLRAFADAGYIEWGDKRIVQTGTPDEATIAAARTTTPFG